MVQVAQEHGRVQIDLINVNENVRDDAPVSALNGLAGSFDEVGQLQPIGLRRAGDRYDLVSGARRLGAAKLAGWTTVDATIFDGELTPAEIIQRQLIENAQRENLSPMEIAAALKKLKDSTGWTVAQIARKVGFSSASVSKFLTLVELPQAIQDKIKSGDINASAGYGLSQVSDAAEQAALASQLADGTLTRDGLTGIVKRMSNSRKQTGSEAPARIKAELSDGRSITVAGAGLTNLDTLIAWLEELLGKARRSRPKGLELGTFVRILKDEAKK
jgi:ParB family chromosome partitioning protein